MELILYCFIAMLFIFNGGCQWAPSSEPSVLVIAVDFLGYELISCEDNNTPSAYKGFEAFCSESVRFTHAYTPSTMSTSALASIFTAKYPIDHKVLHNGKQFLSANHETIAEVAKIKGYNTSFFSFVIRPRHHCCCSCCVSPMPH